jgi:hypothetical protein
MWTIRAWTVGSAFSRSTMASTVDSSEPSGRVWRVYPIPNCSQVLAWFSAYTRAPLSPDSTSTASSLAGVPPAASLAARIPTSTRRSLARDLPSMIFAGMNTDRTPPDTIRPCRKPTQSAASLSSEPSSTGPTGLTTPMPRPSCRTGSSTTCSRNSLPLRRSTRNWPIPTRRRSAWAGRSRASPRTAIPFRCSPSTTPTPPRKSRRGWHGCTGPSTRTGLPRGSSGGMLRRSALPANPRSTAWPFRSVTSLEGLSGP